MTSLKTSSPRTAPPQRWAVVAAWVAFGSTLPSVCWRLAMLAGVDLGFADADFYQRGAGLVYVLALDLIQVCAGFLALGLVRPWGERWPRWVPWWGGRPIRPILPVVFGGLGAVVVMGLCGYIAVAFARVWFGGAEGWTPTDQMSGPQVLLVAVAYAPMLLWGPALCVAVVGYYRRHRPVGARH